MNTPAQKIFKRNDLVEETVRDKRRGAVVGVCDAYVDVQLYDAFLKRSVLVQFRTSTAQAELRIVG